MSPVPGQGVGFDQGRCCCSLFVFLEFLKSGEDSALGLGLLRRSEVIQGFAGWLDMSVLVTSEERRSSARAESG